MNKALITFASWEDRFLLGTIEDVENDNYDKVICFYFEDGQNYGKRTENIQNLTQRIDVEIQKIPLSLTNYKASWETLEKVFKSISSEFITVNISTMTRNMIFSILHFLDANKKRYEVKYYPALKHASQLTKNPSKPELIFQHGGLMLPSLRTALIVLVGYDSKRLQQLYNFFEPAKIIIGVSSNHVTKQPKEYSTNFDYLPNSKTISINSLDHNLVYENLKQQYDSLKDDYNVLLCSLGQKWETIGIYKLQKEYPEIGLVYAPSKDYALDYSSGIQIELVKTVQSLELQA